MSAPQPRLLILPGLNGSGRDHWQTWLAHRHPGSVCLQMADWSDTRLSAWVTQIDATLAAWPGQQWLVVAHSFGCLALAQWAAVADRSRVRSALLVAPANPARFGIAPGQLARRLPMPAQVVTSRSDPWFSASGAQQLAEHWGASVFDAGQAGHINPASGHGPWPLGAQLVDDELWRLSAGPRADARRVGQDDQAPRLRFAV